MKKRRSLILSLVVSLLICGLIMGDSLSSLVRSFQQRFIAQTDTVEVTLIDDLQRSEPIVPGSRIPLDMDVQNLGAACQVRFKVCVYTGGELLRELTEAELELADGWERKKDGYLYPIQAFWKRMAYWSCMTLSSRAVTSSRKKIRRWYWRRRSRPYRVSILRSLRMAGEIPRSDKRSVQGMR
ncbi:hypothetical protein [[Clostridium] innocuum]|uniref:hypothetical protein n=1 Tax=Clostridium innocuum TaxID=1522 RepID=UPI001E418623|nr:hypothetical protein [[Clostridium] innocuum]MCC2832587.1 hypothetical protein [[Clostridium] innocuum]